MTVRKRFRRFECPPALHKNPEVAKKGSETSGESALQMRCIFCRAEGHSETSADTEEEPLNDKNPGQGQGYVASCHQETFAVKVEAPGIEPANEFDATSKPASPSELQRTCCAANALHFGHFISRSKSSSDTIVATLTGKDLIEVAKAWQSLGPQVRESILLLIRASAQKPSVQSAQS